jgi:hypothetical protein
MKHVACLHHIVSGLSRYFIIMYMCMLIIKQLPTDNVTHNWRRIRPMVQKDNISVWNVVKSWPKWGRAIATPERMPVEHKKTGCCKNPFTPIQSLCLNSKHIVETFRTVMQQLRPNEIFVMVRSGWLKFVCEVQKSTQILMICYDILMLITFIHYLKYSWNVQTHLKHYTFSY